LSAGEIVTIVAAVTALFSVLATLRKNRGENAAALAQIAASRDAALAAVNRERLSLKEQTDARIDERISGELKRAYERIGNLEDEVELLKVEPARIKAIIRRFVYSLHAWASENGHDDLPWPSDEDMAVIAPELVDLADATSPSAEVRAAADEARRRPE
jgi:hypothetical protein